MVLNNTSTRTADGLEMSIFEIPSRWLSQSLNVVHAYVGCSSEMSDVVVGFFSPTSSVLFSYVTVVKFH